MGEHSKCHVCGKGEVSVCSYGVDLCHECFMKNPSRWSLQHPSDRNSVYARVDTTTWGSLSAAHARRGLQEAREELGVTVACSRAGEPGCIKETCAHFNPHAPRLGLDELFCVWTGENVHAVPSTAVPASNLLAFPSRTEPK